MASTESSKRFSKSCVGCGEDIPLSRVTCPFCGAEQGGKLAAPPLPPPPYAPPRMEKAERETAIDEQGKRSVGSKIWALGQVVGGGLILASEIVLYILLFSGNSTAFVGELSIQNLLPLVVETLVAIFVAIVMIDGGVCGLRSERKT